MARTKQIESNRPRQWIPESPASGMFSFDAFVDPNDDEEYNPDEEDEGDEVDPDEDDDEGEMAPMQSFEEFAEEKIEEHDKHFEAKPNKIREQEREQERQREHQRERQQEVKDKSGEEQKEEEQVFSPIDGGMSTRHFKAVEPVEEPFRSLGGGRKYFTMAGRRLWPLDLSLSLSL